MICVGVPVGTEFSYDDALSRIDLIREITVDHEFGPSGRGDAAFVGIDSGDRGDNPIGFRQIKPWVHAQPHDRGRGMGFTFAGDDRSVPLAGRRDKSYLRRP